TFQAAVNPHRWASVHSRFGGLSGGDFGSGRFWQPRKRAENETRHGVVRPTMKRVTEWSSTRLSRVTPSLMRRQLPQDRVDLLAGRSLPQAVNTRFTENHTATALAV